MNLEATAPKVEPRYLPSLPKPGMNRTSFCRMVDYGRLSPLIFEALSVPTSSLDDVRFIGLIFISLPTSFSHFSVDAGAFWRPFSASAV